METYFHGAVKNCILFFNIYENIFPYLFKFVTSHISLKTFHIVFSSCIWFYIDKYLCEKKFIIVSTNGRFFDAEAEKFCSCYFYVIFEY